MKHEESARANDPAFGCRPTIMFIRHAEKPDKGHKGVTPDGEHDEHSLSVRGWTRAGALAALFAQPARTSPLTTPTRVIATAPSGSYKSKREHDTALPTAQRLGLSIEAVPLPDTYSALVSTIESSEGASLVVWHHGHLPEFVSTFAIKNADEVPSIWPEERFDLVWVLHPEGDQYVWSDIPQDLLEGDAEPTADLPLQP